MSGVNSGTQEKYWLWKKGQSGNKSGVSRDVMAAREVMNMHLSSPEMIQAWKKAYYNQLLAENAVILKDYADRICGKPKEYLEVSNDPDAPLHSQLSLDELKAVARYQLEKDKALLLERHDNADNGIEDGPIIDANGAASVTTTG